MPNEPQVELCHKETYDKFFSKWEQELVAVRDSNKFRFADCVKQAGNNPIEAVFCGRNFNKQMKADN